MKKRIIGILLTLCMMICLVPTGVFAEGETATGSAAIRLGADALNKTINTADAPTNAWVWIIIGFIALGIGVTVVVFVVRKRKTA